MLIVFEQHIDPELHQMIIALYHAIKKSQIVGLRSITPAYSSITLVFDNNLLSFKYLKRELISIWTKLDVDHELPSRTFIIPVCYDIEFGLDLDKVADRTGLTIEQITTLHAESGYRVYMLGFLPGFLYLGGLPAELEIARKQTPRLSVPKGSVAIGGQQTGIYPSDSPGGWQIIGRTPISLFEPKTDFLIQPGDFIQFQPISKHAFHQSTHQLQEVKNEN